MRLDLGQRLKACISLAGGELKAEVHWEWGQAGRGERERKKKTGSLQKNLEEKQLLFC